MKRHYFVLLSMKDETQSYLYTVSPLKLLEIAQGKGEV